MVHSPLFKRNKRVARLLLTDLKVTKEDLESINKRFLLIVGKNDIISLSDTKAIAGSIPDSRLVVVPKEGHKLAQARPDLFNEYLIEFLKGKKMLNFIKKHRKGLRLVFMLAVFALVVFEFGVLSKEFSLTSLRSYMASYGLGFIFTILALTLGMAPLSMVGTMKTSYISEKIAHMVYKYAGRIYSFKGLRAYKDKYASNWIPRYTSNAPGNWLLYSMLALVLVGRRPVEGAFKISFKEK